MTAAFIPATTDDLLGYYVTPSTLATTVATNSYGLVTYETWIGPGVSWETATINYTIDAGVITQIVLSLSGVLAEGSGTIPVSHAGTSTFNFSYNGANGTETATIAGDSGGPFAYGFNTGTDGNLVPYPGANAPGGGTSGGGPGGKVPTIGSVDGKPVVIDPEVADFSDPNLFGALIGGSANGGSFLSYGPSTIDGTGLTLDTAEFYNISGTLAVDANVTSTGTLEGTITNDTGATIEIGSGVVLDVPDVNNYSLIETAPGTSGTETIEGAFNNDNGGQLDVGSGELNLADGGESSGNAITIAPGATLGLGGDMAINGGTYDGGNAPSGTTDLDPGADVVMGSGTTLDLGSPFDFSQSSTLDLSRADVIGSIDQLSQLEQEAQAAGATIDQPVDLEVPAAVQAQDTTDSSGDTSVSSVYYNLNAATDAWNALGATVASQYAGLASGENKQALAEAAGEAVTDKGFDILKETVPEAAVPLGQVQSSISIHKSFDSFISDEGNYLLGFITGTAQPGDYNDNYTINRFNQLLAELGEAVTGVPLSKMVKVYNWFRNISLDINDSASAGSSMLIDDAETTGSISAGLVGFSMRIDNPGDPAPIVLGGGSNVMIASGDNTTIQAVAGDNMIVAPMGNHVLIAGSGDDTLIGGTGTDFLETGTGNDTLSGGSGTSIAVFSMSHTAYSIVVNVDQELTVTNNLTGTITALSGLSQLNFADGAVVFGTVAQVLAAIASGLTRVVSAIVSDSATNVSIKLDALQGLAAEGLLGPISLTDGGTPNMTLPATQAAADATALARIVSPFTVLVGTLAWQPPPSVTDLTVRFPSVAELTSGQQVILLLNFSEPVSVSGGVPTLALNDGGTAIWEDAPFVGGSGTASLVFGYTVGAGDRTDSLALAAGNAVQLNGASIQGAGGAALLSTANGLAPAPAVSVGITAAQMSAISISGDEANETATDGTPIAPFSGVSFADANSGATVTATVRMTSPAGGTIGDTRGGAYLPATGVYTVTGTPAAVTAAIENLSFTPTAHLGPQGTTEPTIFYLSATDTLGGAATASATTLVTTETSSGSVALVQPVITGSVAGQRVTDPGIIAPLAAVTVGDGNPDQIETVTVLSSAPANGGFGNLGGGSYNASSGVYDDTGTAAAVTTALDGLVFEPFVGPSTPAQTITTAFTIATMDTDGESATDSTTTVVTTAPPVTLNYPNGTSYSYVYNPTASVAETIAEYSDVNGTAAKLWSIVDNVDGTSYSYAYDPTPTAKQTAQQWSATNTSTGAPAGKELADVVNFTNGQTYVYAYYPTASAKQTAELWSATNPDGSSAGSALADVINNTDGTTLVYAYDPVSGVRQTTTNWSATNADGSAAGTETAAVVDNTSGTAIVYAFYASGTIEKTATYYAGYTAANGAPTGSATSLTIDYTNGQSSIATYHAGGGTTVDYSGPDGTGSVIAGITGASLTSAAQSASGLTQAAVQPASIVATEVSGSGQTIDPGVTNATIQFLAGASGDTVVLHANIADTLLGFSPSAGDMLDLRALFAEAGIDIAGEVSRLPDYVSVAQQNDAAVIMFDPAGHGAGSVVATLPDGASLAPRLASGNSFVT